MRQSMTGFASLQGSGEGARWTWEIRGVNGKGLDLRLRMPDWIDGLEQEVRALVSKTVTRGNVTIGLRVQSDTEAGASILSEPQLMRVLDAMARIEAEAMDRGLSLGPATSAQIVALRGVMDSVDPASDTTALRQHLLTDFQHVLNQFQEMRASEGRALETILNEQLDEIARLRDAARLRADEREDTRRDRLRASLARVLDNAEGVDENRLAQELALIAVKSDVTEELDRLSAHVDAARALLRSKGVIGRKLDFLMQEFNREANTLCSKAGTAPLTQVGLTLKTVIDQMREQVQNLE